MPPLGKKLSILHILFSLDPGGMENGVVNVANRLPREAFQVDFCCLERPGIFQSRLRPECRVFTLSKSTGFSWKSVFQLAILRRRLKSDILHTHNLGPLMYASLAQTANRRAKILHGEHAQFAAWENRPKYRLYRRFLYPLCERVHTVSTGQRCELLTANFTKRQIDVIPNGVDTIRFQPALRQSARKTLHLPIQNGEFVIGMVGRFGPHKRHAEALEAFARLRWKLPRIHFLVVGSGGSEELRVRTHIRESPAASRIHYLGFRDDPAPAYQAMDLLILPSVNEGMSNALLEAMASGTPALANRACGNAEVITSGFDGWVKDLSTSEAIAKNLERVIRVGHEKLDQIRRQARQTVIKRFSMDAMVARYERIYRETAAG